MIRLLLIGIVFFASLSITYTANAQVNVQRSDSITLIKGKKFYVHKVEAKQTIYSISRAYNVEVHEIYTYNPKSKELLSLGQKLLIPIKEEEGDGHKTIPIPEAKDGFIFHKVAPGETLYRIGLKYGLKEEFLLKYNPGLSNDIYPGQLIKVPEPEKVVSDMSVQLYDSVFTYEIEEKDTYYQLFIKFKVKKGQLEKLNPQLKQLGLQKGMSILIPVVGIEYTSTPDVSFVPDVLNNVDYSDTSAIVPVRCDSFGYIKPVYKVAFMMPFYENLEPSINVSSAYKMKAEGDYPSFQFIHFYEGFLIAADSMAKLGMNIELFVYDTMNDTATVRRITQKPEFKNLDLIIGPLYTQNLHIVAKAIRGTQTRLVNPFSLNTSLLEANPNLFFLQPLVASKADQMLNYIKDSLANANVIILHNSKRDEVYLANMLKAKYARMAPSTAFDTNRLYVFSYQDGGYNKLVGKLDNNRPNILINLASNEAYISNFVRNLYKKSDNYNLVLMGLESQWKAYKTLEHKYLFALNLTLASPSFVDYRQQDVARFVLQFREQYTTEPNLMAFQGYDAGWFFLNALYRYGTHFESCMPHLEISLLQNDFSFKSGGPNAWQNTFSNIYQYQNYQLIDKKRVLVPIPPEWFNPIEEPILDDELQEGSEEVEKEENNDGE